MRGRSYRSKLERLTPETREALLKVCSKGTLAKGTAWLEQEHGIKVHKNTLCGWLKRQRGPSDVLAPPRKPRPDCPLNVLSAEMRGAVYDYCDKKRLKDGVAWLKKEHGLKTNTESLGRWLQKRRAELANDVRLEIIRDNARRADLVGSVLGAAAALSEANRILVAQTVFEEFQKPVEERDEKRLVAMFTLALKANSAELAQEKFHYEAARLARERAKELTAINAGGESEEEKMKRAMVLLFGERPQVDVTTMTDEECDAVLAGQEEATE